MSSTLASVGDRRKRYFAAWGLFLLCASVGGCEGDAQALAESVKKESSHALGAELVAQPGEKHMPLRDSYYACAANTEGVTQAIQDCIEVEFDYQDARLNSAYKTLMESMPMPERESLREVQRQWIAKRDRECDWDAETEGQGQRLDANSCQLRMTAERADELEAMK